ncbi:uncharacterized protein Z520_02580 [Fonsecaea multimorphosa CBS 102226]|uniref:F-box domain-containing protein n=1 Tax=Fonsecaea multimorphosa CBS 102226 TaxID=1442371 RepID=A0A0D2HKR1_9EURO|nr:uncharacterized protein Z520_02580 [Fonsecaea multimorphosa CBS 102226]KIY02441.1 hypothetical protein Z520_02580 [Fonsecaea multimorphosa CBS 102226]OAL29082.1 hypothetical protein AYO22_02519 [Fonsecaea multimorphosa]
MPKVEKKKRVAKRGPYVKNAAGTETSRVDSSSQKESLPLVLDMPTEQPRAALQNKPLSFLDLPTEIRLQVYQHFVTIPPKTGIEKRRLDRSRVIRTRYSLQLTCRKVSQEWSPLFYSTTTIVIHGLRPVPDDGSPEYRTSRGMDFWGFEKEFVNLSSLSKRKRIQSLAYDCGDDISGDFQSTYMPLISLLREPENTFASLKEVVFYREVCTRVPDRLYRTKSSRDEIVDLVFREGLDWEAVEEMDNMEYLLCKEELYPRWSVGWGLRVSHSGDSEWVENKLRPIKIVDEVQVVFRKQAEPLQETIWF